MFSQKDFKSFSKTRISARIALHSYMACSRSYKRLLCISKLVPFETAPEDYLSVAVTLLVYIALLRSSALPRAIWILQSKL